MPKLKLLFILFAPTLFFVACESIIEPDLRDIPPQLVVEGEISNAPPPYTVRLSMSVGFNDASRFVGVDNALVIVSDAVLPADTFVMTAAGVYQSTKLTGTPGRTYRLRVVASGGEYTAECTMPPITPIDSLRQEDMQMIGEQFTSLKAYYADSLGQENFYRFRLFINGEQKRGNLLSSDENSDGKAKEISFMGYELFTEGDSIKLQIMSIDKEVYNYFSTLQSTLSSQNVAPANPKSNITGGCLGYFSAYAIEEAELIIE